ncbi:hypothetical protein B0H15DRAFT_793482 [Mycena belliarum]|uniref:Uncharacterized protein n=1 Tax=Mycena belliarum TaxID=1033014 RepID=A0AAD6XE41_9AGAR|nr:hypothetical protein B0H15DRAFT_793482 [Mycena belliae]
MKETVMNGMPRDILWLFAVPVGRVTRSARRPPPPVLRRVPLGHWAGDRVLIVDEYTPSAGKMFPAALLAAYPKADPKEDALRFALANLTHVAPPVHKRAADATDADADALFPTDRVWVVRNLTKRWFARADVLVKAKYLRGPAVRAGRGLGDLIFADIGGAMCAVVMGGSAGQRIDVQPLETVENAEEGAEWTDCSKEARLCLHRFDQDYAW